MSEFEQLDKIRETQMEFQRATGFPVDTIVAKERNEIAEKYLFKMIEEVIELRKEFPSVMNPWSKTQKDEDVTRIKEELSDVWLFLINFMNIWKFSNKEVFDMIQKIQDANFAHLKNKKLQILDSEMQKVPDEAVMTGNGNMTPRYVFVGQNPGQGLTKSCKMNIAQNPDGNTSFDLLFRVMGEDRMMDSYFTNLVKVKTPENSEPDDNLVDFWFEFLQKEIEILRYNNPDMKIVAMGNFVYKSIVGGLKGYELLKIPHPAYVLRGGLSIEEYDKVVNQVLV